MPPRRQAPPRDDLSEDPASSTNLTSEGMKVCTNCKHNLSLSQFIGQKGEETKTCSKCLSVGTKSRRRQREKRLAKARSKNVELAPPPHENPDASPSEGSAPDRDVPAEDTQLCTRCEKQRPLSSFIGKSGRLNKQCRRCLDFEKTSRTRRNAYVAELSASTPAVLDPQEENKQYCFYCDQDLPRRHFVTTTGRQVTMCFQCRQKSSRKRGSDGDTTSPSSKRLKSAADALPSEPPLPVAKTFNCDECNKVFPNGERLGEHKRDMHREHQQLVCSECPAGSRKHRNQKRLKRHKKNVHGPKTKLLCSHIECTSKNSKEVYGTQHRLNEHVRRAHSEHKELPCPECNVEPFRTNELLQQHIERIHRPKKYKCNVCGRGFDTTSALDGHFSSAHPKLICEEDPDCGEQFFRAGDRLRHIVFAHGRLDLRIDAPSPGTPLAKLQEILKTRGEKASSEASAGRLDDEVSHEIDDGSHGENDYAVNKETDEEDDEETIEEIFEEAYEEGQDENGEGIHDESHDEEEEESHPESNDESDEESSSDTDEREDHGRIESCLRFNDFKIARHPTAFLKIEQEAPKCPGPAHCGEPPRPCPYELTLTTETTHLYLREGVDVAENSVWNYFILESRCALCSVDSKLGHDGHFLASSRGAQCQVGGCLAMGFEQVARYCYPHFMQASQFYGALGRVRSGSFARKPIMPMFTAKDVDLTLDKMKNKAIDIPADIKFLSNLLNGSGEERPRLWFIDTEFGRNRVIDGSKVIHEVAIVNAKGECVVKLKFAKQSSVLISKASGERLAQAIKECNIQPGDYMIEYGSYNVDTDLVRRALSESGQDTTILPPKNHCYHLVRSMRATIKAIIPKLDNFCQEVLFRIFFIRHRLVGKNHYADVDAVQLQLLFFKVLVPLTKAPAERSFDASVLKSVKEFFPEATAHLEQQTLDSWLLQTSNSYEDSEDQD